MYCQGHDRQKDCMKDHSHHVYIIIDRNQIRHLGPRVRSRDATRFFKANENLLSAGDRTSPALSVLTEDPPRKTYSPTLGTDSLRDLRPPGGLYKNESPDKPLDVRLARLECSPPIRIGPSHPLPTPWGMLCRKTAGGDLADPGIP